MGKKGDISGANEAEQIKDKGGNLDKLQTVHKYTTRGIGSLKFDKCPDM